jgi:hypothetical protein
VSFTPNKNPMLKAPLLLTAVVAMLLGACGAGDGGGAPSGDGNGSASDDEGGSSGEDGLIQHGFVTVDGTTFNFSFDSPGRCGVAVEEGKIAAQGFLVDDPTRQVVFTYGLPEDTPDGRPHMQIVLYDENGEQLWYSAVGYGGDDVGSISSLAKSGNTVTMSGQLSSVADQSIGDFTAEATCDQ